MEIAKPLKSFVKFTRLFFKKKSYVETLKLFMLKYHVFNKMFIFVWEVGLVYKQ